MLPLSVCNNCMVHAVLYPLRLKIDCGRLDTRIRHFTGRKTGSAIQEARMAILVDARRHKHCYTSRGRLNAPLLPNQVLS